jgi:hypothetical protein
MVWLRLKVAEDLQTKIQGRQKEMKCVFVQSVNGKLNCITHRQSLLYVYVTAKGLSVVCQVGEDKQRKRRVEKKVSK